jgi:hypothetical protein
VDGELRARARQGASRIAADPSASVPGTVQPSLDLPRKLGSFQPAFRDAFVPLGVSVAHEDRLASVRAVQWSLVRLAVGAVLLAAAYRLRSAVVDDLPISVPVLSGAAIVAWALKRLKSHIAPVRARWDAEADGLTLFRQLRYRIPWTVRSIDKARLRVMLKLVVVVTPRDLLQHTVTREVVFVAPHRGSVLASWWRARYVTWLLCRHVRRRERYYYGASRTVLLTEITETSLGFRVMQPPVTGEYVFLRLAPA